jgi:hypothetical protein
LGGFFLSDTFVKVDYLSYLTPKPLSGPGNTPTTYILQAGIPRRFPSLSDRIPDGLPLSYANRYPCKDLKGLFICNMPVQGKLNDKLLIGNSKLDLFGF